MAQSTHVAIARRFFGTMSGPLILVHLVRGRCFTMVAAKGGRGKAP